MSGCVYILQSIKDGRRYIGSTDNIERRLSQHNGGQVCSTKHRRPLKLIYLENFDSLSEARQREKFFKTHRGYNELNKLVNQT